jgi:hypothetical protein
MTLAEAAMDQVLERIGAWEADGLIDAATADRLRAAEAGPTSEPGAAAPARFAAIWSASSFFGPTPTIVEVFGYLGAGFFLGAWSAFLARIAGERNGEAILAAGTGLATAVLVALAFALRRGDVRRRRGAGVAVLAATCTVAAAAQFTGQLLHLDSRPLAFLIDAAASVAVASIGRRLLPSLTSQVALLGSLTALGSAVLALLEPVAPDYGGCCLVVPQPADDLVRVVFLPAAGWLVVAVSLGLLGLAEARSESGPALRRASLTRFWAASVALIGLSSSAFRSGSFGNDQYGRLLEPWVGDGFVLVLAVVLLERAIRRGSAAYLVVAAIALVTALTDFNFSYLSESRDVGLVIEGVILLGVGFGADRLRRRLDRPGAGPAIPSGPDPLAA